MANIIKRIKNFKLRDFISRNIFELVKDHIHGINMITDFQQDVLTEYFLWFFGDEDLLREYYQNFDTRINNLTSLKSDNYFYSNIAQGQRVVHSGLAYSIAATKARVLFSSPIITTVVEEGEITTDQDRLNNILKLNTMDLINKTAAKTESWSGCVAFKIIIKPDVDYPIVQLFDKRKFEILTIDNRIQEIVFITHFKQGDKLFELHERYGFGFIKNDLFEVISHDDKQQVGLNTIDQTKDIEPLIEFLGEFIAAGFKPNETMWGRSDYQGQLSEFDALDEAWSGFVRDVRLGAAKVYIPENLQQRDKDGNLIKFDEFNNNINKLANDMSEKGKNELKFQQSDIRATEYKLTLNEIKDNVLENVGLSPVTLGRQADLNDSGVARREKEKATIRTRSEMIEIWKPFLESFYEVLLKSQDLIDNKRMVNGKNLADVGDYVINVKFPAYIEPNSPEEIKNAKELVEASLMSKKKMMMEHLKRTEDEAKDEINQMIIENQAVFNMERIDPDGGGDE